MNKPLHNPPPTSYLRQWQIIGDKKRNIPAPILDIGSATLWRWCSTGHFPQPHKISKGVTAWKKSDVDTWLSSRPQSTT